MIGKAHILRPQTLLAVLYGYMLDDLCYIANNRASFAKAWEKMRYIEDTEENYYPIEIAIAQGGGDCNELARFKLALLKLIGNKTAKLRAFDTGNGILHIQVIDPVNGTVYDPSLDKGMKVTPKQRAALLDPKRDRF